MTHGEQIQELLSDGDFHSNVELCRLVGWRFGGTLHAMRKKGYVFEKERRHDGDKTYVEYWKMLEIPPSELDKIRRRLEGDLDNNPDFVKTVDSNGVKMWEPRSQVEKKQGFWSRLLGI